MISEPMDLETARRIVRQLLASGKAPAAMTFAEQEAVRIVWADIETQLEPVRSALQKFARALEGAAAPMIDYGRRMAESAAMIGYAGALEPAPPPRAREFPGSRPAWQRNGGRR